MDFSLTDDQRLLKDTIRRFMEAEMRPILRQYEKEERFPAEQVRKLGELGCCGMTVAEEWGGSGADTLTYVVMLEEVPTFHLEPAPVITAVPVEPDL